jgi:hypothetical protein
MTAQARPLADTRDAIIAAIREVDPDSWSKRGQRGRKVSTLTTRQLIRVVQARILRRDVKL